MDDAKHEPKAPPQQPAKGESLRDRVGAALLGFLLTGVIGTMVATWFQQRGWAWQNRVTQVEKDTSSALDSLRSVSDLLDKRWSATFQMVSAIENASTGDDAKAARDSFAAVNKDWELQYANVDAGAEFNVDRPFGIDAKRTPDAVWLFPCDSSPFGGSGAGSIEPDSAHIILTVINHCHGLIKSTVEDLGKGSTAEAARKTLLDASFRRLSNIYYINDALRCVILERAVAMRRSLDTELGVGSFFQTGPRIYAIPPKERDCLAPYKDWSDKNPVKAP